MKLPCVCYRYELRRSVDSARGVPASPGLARHLDTCPRCRTAWSGLRGLGADLSEALTVPSLSAGFEQGVWARIAVGVPQRSRPGAPALALGAVAVAVAGATVLAHLRPLENPAHHVMIARQPADLQRESERHPPAGARGSAVAPVQPEHDASRAAGLQPRGQATGSRSPLRMARAVQRPRARTVSDAQRRPASRPLDLVPDAQYLDGRDATLLARWNPPSSKGRADSARVWRRPPPRDDFVRVSLPMIAGRGDAAIAAAAREYEQQAKVVDARLFHKVTLRDKGVALTDLCAELKHQLGVELSASRAVGDEKVTVFVKEEPVRDVMRAVARLFGYFWNRRGQEGAYRYELNQDLRSQLAEGELRNRDFNAALLALDAQMEKLHPYLERRQEGQEQHSPQDRADREAGGRLQLGGWGGAQIYFRLTPAERTALAGGEEIVLRPDDPNPDRRLPAEWQRPILKSLSTNWLVNGEAVPIEDAPGMKVAQVRLHINRTELGQVSLSVRTILVVEGDPGGRSPGSDVQELAIGRNPSATSPENAKANQALRGRPPFDRIVALRPEPSSPSPKGGASAANGAPRSPTPGDAERPQIGTPQGVVTEQPRRVLSADVWEAVHKETGLPIVADFYSHLFPAGSVTTARKSLFDALCGVSDAMGARWTKSGDFLLFRSASYFWDKLKEVPNRSLSHWAHDRDANGGLPLADFLEMAALSDEQLRSQTVGDAIRQCWGLGEWGWLSMADRRLRARFLGTLSPAQLQRTLQREGLPLHDMTPAQQGAAYQCEQAVASEAARQGASSEVSPLWWHGTFKVTHIPSGYYIWTPPDADPKRWEHTVGARTAPEALALARRLYAPASAQEVQYSADGYFTGGVWY